MISIYNCSNLSSYLPNFKEGKGKGKEREGFECGGAVVTLITLIAVAVLSIEKCFNFVFLVYFCNNCINMI